MKNLLFARRLSYVALTMLPRQIKQKLTNVLTSVPARHAPTPVFKPLVAVVTFSILATKTASLDFFPEMETETPTDPGKQDQDNKKETHATKSKIEQVLQEEIDKLKKFYLTYRISYGDPDSRDFSDENGFIPLSVKLTQLTTGAAFSINKRLDESIHKLLTQSNVVREHRTPFHEWINSFWESIGSDQYTLVELFHQLTSRRETQKANIVLMIGEPGMGKSILCQKMAHAWAQEDSTNYQEVKTFEFVLHIDLAETTQEPRLLLQQARNMIFSDEAVGKEGEKEKTWHNKKILWILDHFDRLPPAKREKVEEFLTRLPANVDWTVVTSSRSYAYPAISYSQVFTVEGFENDNIRRYIARFFNFTKNSHDSKRTQKLIKLADEVAEPRKMFHAPYFLRLLCDIASSRLIDEVLDEKGRQWLARTSRLSRTAFLDQYAITLFRTNKVLEIEIKEEDPSPLINILYKNYSLKSKIQSVFKDDILKIYFESCDLACQLLINHKLPETFVTNRYHPAQQWHWIFMAGHLTLFHEANPECGQSPNLLLQYFGYNSLSVKQPDLHKDLFGFYENALLIRCIDEFTGTHQTRVTSIQYYAIITRLAKWFKSLLEIEDQQSNWLMHPILKEAIASSDFIFSDPVIGELFEEKLSSLYRNKKIHLVMNLMQVVSNIGLNHLGLNKIIRDIAFDSDADFLIRCSAFLNQIQLIPKNKYQKKEVNRELFKEFHNQLIQDNNILIKAFSCFSIATLIKHKAVNVDEMERYLLGNLDSQDVIMRAAAIYILSFYPAADIFQLPSRTPHAQFPLIRRLISIESNSQEDTWVRLLACKTLAAIEQHTIIDINQTHNFHLQLSHYKSLLKNTLPLLRCYVEQNKSSCIDFFIKYIIQDKTIANFLATLPEVITTSLKPVEEKSAIMTDAEELTYESLQRIVNNFFELQLDRLILLKPEINRINKEIADSSKVYEKGSAWAQWIGKLLVSCTLYLDKGELEDVYETFKGFIEKEPIEQLVLDFFTYKKKLDDAIKHTPHINIKAILEKNIQSTAGDLNDFMIYFFSLYVVLKSTENNIENLNSLELLVYRQQITHFSDHVIKKFIECFPKELPDIASKALVNICDLLLENHDYFFPLTDQKSPRYVAGLNWLQTYTERNASAVLKFFQHLGIFLLEKQLKELVLFKIDFNIATQVSQQIMPTSENRGLQSRQPLEKALLKAITIYAIYSGFAVTITAHDSTDTLLMIQSPILAHPIKICIVGASPKQVIKELSIALPQELNEAIIFSPSSLLPLLRNKTNHIRDKITRSDDHSDSGKIHLEIIQDVIELIKLDCDLINEQNIDGETLLMLAIRKGEKVLVEKLLEFKSDINIMNYHHDSAIEICSEILQKKIKSTDKAGAQCYYEILKMLFLKRELPSYLEANNLIKALHYYLRDFSQEELKILLSASSQLGPANKNNTVFADAKKVHYELIKLIISSWDRGDDCRTWIDTQMSYYLSALLVDIIKFQEKPQENQQNLDIIMNEIKILSEMMRIYKDRLIINMVDRDSFQQIFKLQVIENLTSKIVLLAQDKHFREMVIPICDDSEDKHCFYLAVRADSRGYIFRIENLAFSDELSEVKEFHPFPHSPWIEGHDKRKIRQILPVVILQFKLEELATFEMQRKIKSILGRALWNQELFMAEEAREQYPIIFKRSYIGQIAKFTKLASSKMFILFNLIQLFIYNLRSILLKSPYEEAQYLGHSLKYSYLLVYTLLCAWLGIQAECSKNHSKKAHSIYRDHLDFERFQQQVNEHGYRFVELSEQTRDNCVLRNYAATQYNRLYCFFKESDQSKKSSEQAHEFAKSRAIEFHKNFMEPNNQLGSFTSPHL